MCLCVGVCVLLSHCGQLSNIIFIVMLLYQVIATHLYHGEDEDELTFEKGAIIYVVPYEDPDDEVSLYILKCLQRNYSIVHIG